MADRRCLTCDTDISQKHKVAKYCSDECRRAPRFWGRYCEFCNKELVVSPPEKNTARFCGSRHRYLYENPNFKENFFKKPTLENSYWAGFIAADGCIYKSKSGKRELLIGLAEVDKDHLLKFKSAIGAGNINNSVNTTAGKGYVQSKYQLYSDDVCQDLENLFGIVERKSLILEPPNLNGDLALAYIAGYIDGDGCYTHTNNTPRLTITGTRDVLLWISKQFNKEKEPKLYKKIYNLYYNGPDAIEAWNSYRALDVPFLERKKEKWLKMDNLKNYKLFRDEDHG